MSRLRVDPLSPEAVARLAEPNGIDAQDLYRKTGGNPFFVTEVLAAGDAEIPNTVRDAVLARAARLSPEARALLEAVAVVPPHGELWLLEALAPKAVDRVDECLTSGMLISERDGVAFHHELARRAVEESLPLNRRATLHRKALAALAAPPKVCRILRGSRTMRRQPATLRRCCASRRGGRARSFARRASRSRLPVRACAPFRRPSAARGAGRIPKPSFD